MVEMKMDGVVSVLSVCMCVCFVTFSSGLGMERTVPFILQQETSSPL